VHLKIYGIDWTLVGLQKPVFLDKYARSKLGEYCPIVFKR
jgi:hypothetical protein